MGIGRFGFMVLIYQGYIEHPVYLVQSGDGIGYGWAVRYLLADHHQAVVLGHGVNVYARDML